MAGANHTYMARAIIYEMCSCVYCRRHLPFVIVVEEFVRAREGGRGGGGCEVCFRESIDWLIVWHTLHVLFFVPHTDNYRRTVDG